MRVRLFPLWVCACGLLLASADPLFAQIFEAVGSRAQGMGGAFVAVANDGSATWWNPAGLAEGPFVDIPAARSTTEVTEELPARRDQATWTALGTPPLGFSYYRLKITDIQPSATIEAGDENREDGRAGVPVRSFSARQFGITLLQTLLPGVHAGTTLKYVHGTVRTAVEDELLPPSELLDRGEDLEGGDGEDDFDLDIGVLIVTGPVRLGFTARNLRDLEYGAGQFTLARQMRAGAAFDVRRTSPTPLIVAVDADTVSYDTGTGERRVIAVGAEQWLLARRLGLRGGARFNTVGAEDRAGTAGVSVALRPGLFIDGHVIRGTSDGDRGWGVATRVSF